MIPRQLVPLSVLAGGDCSSIVVPASANAASQAASANISVHASKRAPARHARSITSANSSPPRASAPSSIEVRTSWSDSLIWRVGIARRM